MVFVKKKKEHIHKENSKNTKIVKNRKVKKYTRQSKKRYVQTNHKQNIQNIN